MRGHLTERRPGVWRLVVSDGFDASGKRRQIIRTAKGTRRDAERALTDMLKDLDDHKLSVGRQSLELYLAKEWLPGVSAVSKRGRPLAPTTRQRYSDSVRHVSDYIGKIRLADLRPSHVERLRDALLGEKLAPQTVSDVLRVLAQALSRAEARGLLGRNPAAPELVHRPVGARKPFPLIDAALAQRILDSVVGTPLDAAVHLALGLGLRREELLALLWEDVGDTVRIRRALTYAGGELHLGPPKSAAGSRDIATPGFVARALRRHRATQGERMLRLGGRSDLVVDRGDGQPWMPASFSTYWARFATAHGFGGIGLHGLRHGAASLLLAAGVADKVALDVMGHADVRILRHYQEVAEELKRDAATRMDSLLGRL